MAQGQLPVFTFIPFIELLVLSFLSKMLFTRLAMFFQFFVKRQTWIYYSLAILFLPGTYIHELSHWLVAKLLFVRTYGMSLRPKIEKDSIKMGSVEIEKTDFIRRFLIGSAPFTVGTTLLVGSMYVLVINNWHVHPLFAALEILFVFQVGNTMFMSKKDWEGAWKVLAILVMIVSTWYGIGAPIESLLSFLTNHEDLFKTVSIYLSIPIAFDLLIIFFLSLF